MDKNIKYYNKIINKNIKAKYLNKILKRAENMIFN